MNCPDIEKIIQFVEKAPDAEDADCAAHILKCPECRLKFQEAFECCTCNYTPTPEDIAEAEKIVKEFQSKPDKLEEILDYIKSKLKIQSSLILRFEKIPYLTAPAVTVFAAASPAANPVSAPAPKIFFSANVSNDSPKFWQACVTLPGILSKTSLLDVVVTDSCKQPILKSVLFFRGIPVKIDRGKGRILLKDFLSSTQDRDIKLCFPDGCVVNGRINLK